MPVRPSLLRRSLQILCVLMFAAACQPLDVPPGEPEFGDGATGGAFRARNGWAITFVPADGATPAHCRGRRETNQGGVSITIIGGERRSGFILRGLPPERGVPAKEEVVALFDDGERRVFQAAREGDRGLRVMFPTRHYDDTLHPLARGANVILRGRRMGPLGTLSLEGSSWAINATDECRRINVPPA